MHHCCMHHCCLPRVAAAPTLPAAFTARHLAVHCSTWRWSTGSQANRDAAQAAAQLVVGHEGQPDVPQDLLDLAAKCLGDEATQEDSHESSTASAPLLQAAREATTDFEARSSQRLPAAAGFPQLASV